QNVTLHEGEKNRLVLVTFPLPTPPVEKHAPRPPSPPAFEEERPIPTASWLLGGLGVLALGSYGTFGALGLSERSENHCDTGCSSSQKKDVDAKLQIADISLGVAVVALGAATWFYLARPTIRVPTDSRRDASVLQTVLIRLPELATGGLRF